MPYFNVEFEDKILQKLAKASDEICEEMLREASPILTDSLKKTITQTVSDESSGELVKSIKSFEPSKSKSGVWYVTSSPTGKSKGQRQKAKVFSRSKSGRMTSGRALWNDDKLWWLEYGNSKQRPRPVLARAVNNARSAVIAKMTEVFDRKVSK